MAMWKKKKWKKKWKKILDWIETQWNLPWFYFEQAMRWVFQEKLGDWYDAVYLLFLRVSTFAQRNAEDDIDKICIDQDGLHFKNDEWQNTDACNRKKCVAHDTVKEMRCPVMPAVVPEGCQIIKGNSKDYPRCCDQIKCNPKAVAPYIEEVKPIYWIDESYKYV